MDEDMQEDTLKEMADCNICYIDSVLTMLKNPRDVLEKILIPNFDFIFLSRVYLLSKTKHKSYAWEGMEKPSDLWEFNYEFFEEICSNYKLHFNSEFSNVGSLILSK